MSQRVGANTNSHTMTKPPGLLITRNLPPLVGGMERLMQSAATGLAENFDLTVIGPKDCRQHLPPDIRVIETSSSPAGFLELSFFHGILSVLIRRPTIIIGGSGLLAPTLLFLQTVFRIPAMVFVHGLDIVVDSSVYQMLFVPCLRGIRQLIANSQNTKQLACAHGVDEQRITIINPGTDLPELDKQAARQRFREQHQITADNIMLFVGRVTPRKGLLGFTQRSLASILPHIHHIGH